MRAPRAYLTLVLLSALGAAHPASARNPGLVLKLPTKAVQLSPPTPDDPGGGFDLLVDLEAAGPLPVRCRAGSRRLSLMMPDAVPHPVYAPADARTLREQAARRALRARVDRLIRTADHLTVRVEGPSDYLQTVRGGWIARYCDLGLDPLWLPR